MFDFRSLFDLRGRRALVIGAGRGIGHAGAHALAQYGAEVICADRDAGSAKNTAGEIVANGGESRSLHIDIADEASVRAAVADVGNPDILVSSAAIDVRKRLLDVSDAEFDDVVDVNLRGPFRLMRAFGGAMAERGSGSIILFSSVRAQVVEPGRGVYAATKAGTLQLVRALASELGPRGVRVNALTPGPVSTPLNAEVKNNEIWNRAYADKTALRRWQELREVVGGLVFLASDASTYVTGSYFLMDGGWTAVDGRFDPALSS